MQKITNDLLALAQNGDETAVAALIARMMPAIRKGAAAATAHQYPFADQRRQRLAQGIARHAKLGGELAFGGQLHARFQLLFFNQRPHARGNLVGQASGHHYHGIIQVKT